MLQEAIKQANLQRDEKMIELAEQGVSTLANDPTAGGSSTRHSSRPVSTRMPSSGRRSSRPRRWPLTRTGHVRRDDDPRVGLRRARNDEVAEADFRPALTLIPDYESALAGLDAIGATEGE